MDDRTVVTGGPERLVEGKYLLGEPLGSGGMGVVYAARHTGLDVAVAVKLMNSVRNAVDIARFNREARAAAAIRHAHVVQVSDCGVDPDLGPYLVMEMLEGQTLSKHIAEEGPMPLRRAIAIAMQLLEGLAAGHERAIVHRDVKPANVFLCDRDDGQLHVKLLDFGTSKSMVDPRDDLTRVGTVFGTPPYLAPELLAGDPPDPRADLYAVGVLLYRMLTGESPFGDLRADALADAMLRGNARSLGDIRSDAPAPLVDLVTRAMSVSPGLRPAGALAMREELAAIDAGLAHTIEAAVRPSLLSQGAASASALALPNWALALIAVLLVLTGLGIGYALTLPPAPTTPVFVVPPAAPQVAPTSAAPQVAPTGAAPALAEEDLEADSSAEATEEDDASSAPDVGRRARARRARRRAPASAEQGFLTLSTTPWTQVFEGSHRLGDTPLIRVPLSPGRHTLTLRNPERDLRERIVVDVVAGQTVTRRLGL